jgi:predicted nucleic acid-binding protein
MPYLVDSNIMLRLCDRTSDVHELCVKAVSGLIRNGEDLHCCAQTLIEFWVVATRPRDVNGLALSASAALAQLTDFKTLLTCLPEPPDIAATWQQLVTKHSVLGRKAHDTRLVALMLLHGIDHVLTLNTSDFERFTEIRVVSPSDLDLSTPS